MIIERPVASFLVAEIDSLADLVVANCIPVAVIGERAVTVIRGWDVGENPNRGWRPRSFGDDAAGEDAVGRRDTTIWKALSGAERVRLAGCDRIAQSI